MIRFERVGKRYPPDINALTDIQLEVEDGELIAIDGHSGAGKSTLLKLIAAIEKPTSGVVLVGGQNVSALGRKAIPFFGAILV